MVVIATLRASLDGLDVLQGSSNVSICHQLVVDVVDHIPQVILADFGMGTHDIPHHGFHLLQLIIGRGDVAVCHTVQ